MLKLHSRVLLNLPHRWFVTLPITKLGSRGVAAGNQNSTQVIASTFPPFVPILIIDEAV